MYFHNKQICNDLSASNFSLIKFYMEGPEKELLQLSVFGELQALFPGVHIHIELVGPAIPPQRSNSLMS